MPLTKVSDTLNRLRPLSRCTSSAIFAVQSKRCVMCVVQFLFSQFNRVHYWWSGKCKSSSWRMALGCELGVLQGGRTRLGRRDVCASNFYRHPDVPMGDRWYGVMYSFGNGSWAANFGFNATGACVTASRLAVGRSSAVPRDCLLQPLLWVKRAMSQYVWIFSLRFLFQVVPRCFDDDDVVIYQRFAEALVHWDTWNTSVPGTPHFKTCWVVAWLAWMAQIMFS